MNVYVMYTDESHITLKCNNLSQAMTALSGFNAVGEIKRATIFFDEESQVE